MSKELTREDILAAMSQQPKRKPTPAERQRAETITRRITASMAEWQQTVSTTQQRWRAIKHLVGEYADQSERLSGDRDSDFWRLALEIGHVTGLYLDADEFAELPVRDCIAIMRAAADMKDEQREQMFHTIRQASSQAPRPGTRGAMILKSLYTHKAFDGGSLISIGRFPELLNTISEPGSYKSVVAELKRAGFIETATGRRGGCWLTRLGRHIAESIS
jgi:hypothetical protein